MLYITKDLFKDNAPALQKWVNTLTKEATTSIYAQEIKNELSNLMNGAIGSPAMDFTQNDTADKPVSLSSFKGKYVLLDFWASWCLPCRKENPTVVKAFENYKDKNFTVLGVSLDQNADNWKTAIKQDSLLWQHVSDLKGWGNEVALQFEIFNIPQNFLLDPEGNIIAKNIRGASLERKLRHFLIK